MSENAKKEHLRRYYLFSYDNNYPTMIKYNLVGLKGIEHDLSVIFNSNDPRVELRKTFQDYQNLTNEDLNRYEKLLFDIEIGDIICLFEGKKIGAIGVVTSNYQYNQNKELPHTRQVSWIYEGEIIFEDGNHRLKIREIEKEETYEVIESIVNEAFLKEEDNELYINYPSRITVNSYLKFFKNVTLNPHELELLSTLYLNPQGLSLYELQKIFDGIDIEDSIEFLSKKISLRFKLKSVEQRYAPNIFNGILRDGHLCLILKKELMEAMKELNMVDVDINNDSKTGYDIKQALVNCVCPREFFENAINLLHSKKVLQIVGPWLSGKSYFGRRLAYLINNNCNLNQILHLKMHTSLTYEDLLINDQNKILYRFVEKARRDSLNNYVILIEDAHEVDLNSVFGEFMYLLEDNNREKEGALDVIFDTQKYYIPQNIYVIITSRNISTLNDKLFASNILIFDMPALYNNRFISMFENKSLGQEIAEKFTEVNDILKNYNFSINHGLFLKSTRGVNLEEYEIVVNYKIKPILKYILEEENFRQTAALCDEIIHKFKSVEDEKL